LTRPFRLERPHIADPNRTTVLAKMRMIGVISDTHGLLRPEAIAALRGVEHILHAGDVGDPLILEKLRELAPVTAIGGNIDVLGPCSYLPATEVVTLHGHTFYMLHDRHALDLDPKAAGWAAVVSGHSHRPLIEWRHGVLYLNPGSAGPRRFSLPISLALVTIGADSLQPQLVNLL
jgi:putative phosphoesterase